MNDNCPVHGIYPFQHSPSDNPFAKLCLCFGSSETVAVAQPDNNKDSFSAKPQACISRPSSPIQSPVTSPVTSTSEFWCFMCDEVFSRWQERDRHELVHLPFHIHCPAPGCAWRGNRQDAFRTHWHREDLRSYHEQFGFTPEQGQIETYNPKEILDKIKNGTIPLLKGQEDAVLLVQIQSYQLEKPDMLTHPWGKNRRYEVTKSE